ncbi:AAC(3) family N-acetyltransferase [Ectothiorhodospira shaposhnikovii]|uniref:AAC(3) family N-acetyltransferase n=1 Tax=Ectothiorhodospira shaposhnikovii TaxID=1054 RepID=UPI001EE97CA2|nr:AAC(3) family N-acetyltransferase [Ectothiorhodospira shaposhnikovii]MCG5512080.1 AAC(3) family N-acetyltransferase [Ectothiorhodospira shaposhnikovii]
MRIIHGSKFDLRWWFVKCFLSYQSGGFSEAISQLGLRRDDVVMIHSSWRTNNGFVGRPTDMIATLRDVVGINGLLVFPSLIYQNESSKEFLIRNVAMDVRRSPSQMGLLSEVFRRGKGVRRSLSPTHPLLAWGHRAEEFLVGHDEALVPFGPQSPFGRLLEWNGKILTIDAPFSTVTFTHFLEDRIAQTLPVPLYEPEPMEGTVIDYEGVARKVPVKVLSATANRLRRDDLLEAELLKEGVLKRRRVGNTRLGLLDCRAMTEVVDHMVATGRHFFDSPQ